MEQHNVEFPMFLATTRYKRLTIYTYNYGILYYTVNTTQICIAPSRQAIRLKRIRSAVGG